MQNCPVEEGGTFKMSSETLRGMGRHQGINEDNHKIEDNPKAEDNPKMRMTPERTTTPFSFLKIAVFNS